MICITVTESDGEYISVESDGHAGYAEEGQDIICAAVSALIVNTVNSVETFDRGSDYNVRLEMDTDAFFIPEWAF